LGNNSWTDNAFNPNIYYYIYADYRMALGRDRGISFYHHAIILPGDEPGGKLDNFRPVISGWFSFLFELDAQAKIDNTISASKF
jgi:hypothetical protein